ncbi:MAG TPA: Hpt domain-containing protein, partial [Candidatus Obscuribacter sp.]|nr:Hpt domain-containing protein [Candidatus Obscuribacter sp.]
MPQDEEFLKRLRAAFLEEGGEILAEISKRLADLENTADFPEQVNLLGKVAAQLHSLKGSARAVNEDDLVGICQGLETVFLSLKKTDQDNLPRHLLVAQPVLLEIVDTMNEFFDTQAGITSEGLTPVEKSGLKAAVDIKLSMLNHRLGKS